MKFSVFMASGPEDCREFFQRTVESNPNRSLAHPERAADFRCRAAHEHDLFDDVALSGFKGLKDALAVEGVIFLPLLGGQSVGKAVEFNLSANACAAQRVDGLVACHRVQPWHEREGPVPGRPLEMDSEQDLLDDILEIGGSPS